MKKNILALLATLIIFSAILCFPMGVRAAELYFPDATVGVAYEEHVSIPPDPGHQLIMRVPIPDVPGLNCRPEGDDAYIYGVPTAAGDYHFNVTHEGADDIYALHIKVNPALANANVKTETKSNDPAPHVHSYEWEVATAATETSDGEMIYVCQDSSCRHISERIRITGQSIFMTSTVKKILNAEENATIHISAKPWISFDKTVLEAMKKRRDVTIVIDFFDEGYKGNPMQITIPAGFPADLLFDENGWGGFLFMKKVLETYRP